jgi:hypothetical protein
MKTNNHLPITLLEWEARAFKNGIKTQITLLADPQPENKSLSGSNFAVVPEYFKGAVDDILYCKEHKIHLQITEAIKVLKLNSFTDQDALNEGVAALYPHSNVGDDFFYLPDKIMAASALECFKHYWNSQPANKDFNFDKNPFVVTLGLKFFKL